MNRKKERKKKERKCNANKDKKGYKTKMNERTKRKFFFFFALLSFYGISNIFGYLRPNTVYTYIINM